MTTCLPTSNNFSYMMLNLVGEVGELASKVAKAIRKDELAIGGMTGVKLSGEQHEPNHLYKMLLDLQPREEQQAHERELMKEAGDILWQLSGLCSTMGWELEDIAKMNLEKLSARKQAGTIDGNGDGVSGEERTV